MNQHDGTTLPGSNRDEASASEPAAGRDDPGALERRSDSLRADVGQTLDALQRNYSPGVLVDRSIDLFKKHGGELGANLASSVKRDPLPALLTLVGIGWMMISQARQTRPAGNVQYDTAAEDDGLVGLDSASGRNGSSVRTRLRDAKDSATASVSSGAHRVADGSRRIAAGAKARTRQAQEGLQTMFEEQPFVVGAVGLALGAVIGAALPESEIENRALGGVRERALANQPGLGDRPS